VVTAPVTPTPMPMPMLTLTPMPMPMPMPMLPVLAMTLTPMLTLMVEPTSVGCSVKTDVSRLERAAD